MVILEFDPPARTVGTGTERFRRSQRRRMQPLTWVGDPSACALLSARTLGAKEGLGTLPGPGLPRADLVAPCCTVGADLGRCGGVAHRARLAASAGDCVRDVDSVLVRVVSSISNPYCLYVRDAHLLRSNMGGSRTQQ